MNINIDLNLTMLQDIQGDSFRFINRAEVRGTP